MSAVTKLKKQKSNTGQHKLLETFLFFPKLGTTEQKLSNLTQFFDNINNIDDYLEDCIVFLNQNTALQHSRFVQTNPTVLKAYVPHVAIVGRTHGLALKKGAINKGHIHGCFPQPHKSKRYVKNPNFNELHHPVFLHTHELVE